MSARDDLNLENGTYTRGFGYANHGGIDMKLTSHELFEKMQFKSISSPAYDDVPPFQWSTSTLRNKVRHFGMPDLWTFKPVTYEWTIP